MLGRQMTGFIPVVRGLCIFLCLFLGTGVGVSEAYRSGDVRLVGGANKYEGTVLVMSRGIWKSVCGIGWNILDASVVCRQLGFRGIRRSFRSTKFGEGNSNRLKVKFSCRGNEENLIGCPRRLRRNARLIELCHQQYRSAGIVCKSDRTTTPRPTTTLRPTTTRRTTTTTKATTPKPTKATTPKPTTTLPSTTRASTRKTTTSISGKKKTKDDRRNKISISHSSAANRSEPEIKSKAELDKINNLKDDKQNILKDEGTGSNTVGSLPANMDLKDVKNNKESIPSAGSSVIDSRIQEKKKINVKEPEESEKSVAHTDNSSDKEEKSESEKESSVDQSKDHQDKEKKFKVTLSGGRYTKEGHVAILLPGTKKWGVVCGDHWTYFEGSVVCRQLGLNLIKQVFQVNYFGGTHLPKLFARIRCHGNESHLADCETFEYYNQVKCSKQLSVAGVICTNELPDLVPDAKALKESIRLEDRPLYYLTCSMEENCLADEAYEIKEHSRSWITAHRRLLRFSSIVYNKGTADFIPNAPKDAWEWHQCHMHYHSMEVFAHYDIMDLEGNRIAQGHKASFCLEDTRCPPGITPKYNCLGFGDQGLSVNCSDNYYHDIDCQWIDITGMAFGHYILKVEFNPKMHVSEMTFDNNVVECSLYYTGTYAYLRTCDIVPLRRSD